MLFIYLFKCICLYVADGRPNGWAMEAYIGFHGWADQDQTWHRDSCLPKECFSQGQGHLSVRAV